MSLAGQNGSMPIFATLLLSLYSDHPSAIIFVDLATPPREGPLPPPYEASSPMKGFSSRTTFPSGIKELYSPAHRTIDIVFVHGITADRDATWTGQNSSEPWPKTLLPSVFPTARTLAFGYNAYVSDVQGKELQQIIFQHGWDLLICLSSFRNKDGTALFTSSTPSLTSSIQWEQHSSIFRSTRGIGFFGTPLVLRTPPYEADLSRLAKIVTQSIGLVEQKNIDVVDIYRRGFQVILKNNPISFDTMHKARTAGGLPPIEIVCFYEELSTEGLGFVVPRSSAVLPPCPSFGIHRNHMDMTKFATVDDPGFIAVCERLRQWIMEADPNASSAGCIARQYGNNCQYNMFGKGVQRITGGHFFEADGDMNFLEIPPLPANERNNRSRFGMDIVCRVASTAMQMAGTGF